MAVSQVKKVVAVCFLEAAKTVLDQLGQHRIEMTERGLDGMKDFPQLYGDIRRMRDYLQRSIGAFQDDIELDLEPADLAVLTACCRRTFEAFDYRLEGSGLKLTDQDRDWLQRKRQMLGDWAVTFAAKPLLELPLPRLGSVVSNAMKGLAQRLNHKLFGPQAAAAPMGFESFRGSPGGGMKPSELPAPPPPLDDFGEMAAMLGQSVRAPAAAAAVPATPNLDDPHAVLGKGIDAVPVRGTGGSLLDARQLRDPRLRALIALDQRAFDRAMDVKDYRLAAVHLASILEGAILDHAIPRRVELGLAGGVDSWNSQDILLRVLGDTCAPKDKSFVFHIFAARNLLRPSLQLVSPMVVTGASLERLVEFAVRSLRQMGYQGSDVGSSGYAAREFGIPGA